MFAPGDPKVLGVPPGADFPAALAAALIGWAGGQDPAALARVTVYVNTARMRRRLGTLLSAEGARLLPRIALVTDIARDPAARRLPTATDPLRRRLELEALVARLIETLPDAPPAESAFALADSLAALIDEMHREGVDPAALRDLDLADQSGHWDRNRRFLALTLDYLAATRDGLDPEERMRLATAALIDGWQVAPPADPVIVAGSTGSRGTTLMLMEAVARLPRGLLVLPGLDPDLPPHLWQDLAVSGAEDHPQYRFARILDTLGLAAGDTGRLPGAAAPDPDRNRFLSLALRPAPVTDQWLRDGPLAGDPAAAMERVSLIEAPSPRIEAQAIALAIRAGLEDRRVVALVTPDRMLTRRVSAHLDRWGIVADDSAGRPLGLSPPGRLLRLVAGLPQGRVTAETLLSLLKHPLTNAGGDRRDHLRLTRDLELFLRRRARAFPTATDLTAWADGKAGRADWAAWVAGLVDALPEADILPLADHVRRHLSLAEAAAAGPGSGDPGPLWQKQAGRAARLAMDALSEAADAGREMTARDYADLAGRLLEREVRDPDTARPDAMIWGTMEARVQGADLVILGGLNEDRWPAANAADPWLNRTMRKALGLPLPERRIGLAAHDFQQAAAAPRVILSRAVRLEDTEPVPSRWLNRLTNLLDGLEKTGGKDALAQMRARGRVWTGLARGIDRPEDRTDPAPRPAPRPPVAERPAKLSVTDFERLIRDPYAIYAKRILGLRRLDPLRPEPEAALRGQVLHKVFERFMTTADAEGLSAERLVAVAEDTLRERVGWPVIRQLWLSRIAQVADWFVAREALRESTFLGGEVKGALYLPEADFTLEARADRIDRLPDGRLAILDYKTGKAPTLKEMQFFDKQLLLEALIAIGGGFEHLEATDVGHVAHLELGRSPAFKAVALEDKVDNKANLRFAPASIRADLLRLLAAWGDRGRGYAARRAVDSDRFEGDYDHLARYGEWDDSTDFSPEDVG